MRRYAARPPATALAKIIDYVWASQGAPAHAKERVVPTGTVELAIGLVDGTGRMSDAAGRSRRLSAALVSGPYRRSFTFDTTANASVVGVHLKAGYAQAVLGVPPGELTDQHLDLEALWGRRARELRERLCAATTTEQRFMILEAELLSRLDAQQPHPAVDYGLEMLRQPDVRVSDIAKTAGVSQRRLIEVFTAAVGVSPKRFGRIMRFHRAAALARSTPFDWTRIAHACGYYDQSHLIRDFRELAEVTPGDFTRASFHESESHQFAVPEG